MQSIQVVQISSETLKKIHKSGRKFTLDSLPICNIIKIYVQVLLFYVTVCKI